MLKRISMWCASALALAAAVVVLLFVRDMNRAHERIRGRSDLIPSPLGDIEYLEGGRGPAVLVIHGSGGGYDQGELLAQALLDEGFHWIALSRFGYLRSTFHEGATFAEQADAYVYLLDHLGIESSAVIALSHGGPSALLLAARHPERVSSLTLLSAGVASSDDPGQLQANRQGDLLNQIFHHDSLYWIATAFLRAKLLEVMGADAAVVESFTPEQRQLVDRVVDFMHPVSLRASGVRFDHHAALPNGRIAAIQAPTLVLHARDDTLQRYRNAEFAAATIPDAELVSYDRGGHLLLAVEQADLRQRVQRHILRHVEP